MPPTPFGSNQPYATILLLQKPSQSPILAHYLHGGETSWHRAVPCRPMEEGHVAISAVGAGLALLVDRRFALIPLVVGGFLLQHAVQGWCPPLPLFRRGGVRTQTEIEQERYALKAIRGDFEQMREGNPGRANRALHAVNG